MIKGVSRQIIEVTQTQNVGADTIEHAAENYLKDLKPPHSLRNSKRLLFKAAEICISAVAGSVITSIILLSGVL